MGFFKKLLGEKAKQKNKDKAFQHLPPTPPFDAPGKDHISELPQKILENIFRLVCPHAADESYDSCEDSTQDGACMLCDQRDLSNCVKVNTRWRKAATSVLYNSLRFDPVHYCEREGILADKRKRKSFFNSNNEGEDPATVRLRLLCRTLQADPRRLGALVLFLKLPYMLRETCKVDLARAISACPNLLYVDLPEGIFVDDASCLALRAEVEARCPNLKKMAYLRGSERSLAGLSAGHTWPNLEVLELTSVKIDISTLRRVFGALPYLHTLKVSNMKMFTDNIFQDSQMLPPFPALKELHLEETHNITAEGLAMWINQTDTFGRLQILCLTATGVLPSSVHLILAEAKNLEYLSIVESITRSFPVDADTHPLSSTSLHTLHWEMTSGTSSHSFASEDLILSPYYAYLRNSLLSQNLPNLKELYVRDPGFPETLADLAPPKPRFAANSNRNSNNPFAQSIVDTNKDSTNRNSNNPFVPSHRQTQSTQSHHNFASRNPFNTPPASPPPTTNLGISQSLTIYSKGLDEMEWNFSFVQPTAASNAVGNRGSMISITPSRPISAYGMLADMGNMGPAWCRDEARKSVMVGNGFGGFLAVPESEVRPSTSSGEKGKNKEKRSTRMDIWR